MKLDQKKLQNTFDTIKASLLFVSMVTFFLLKTLFSSAQTSIEEKEPVFGGACRLCPWGVMAEVVQTAMIPYGYNVQICYNCNAADAPRIVSEARTPPPYRPDPNVPEILAPRNVPGLGKVDFGATAIKFLSDAYHGTGIYEPDGPRSNLRLIANIQSPGYFLVAAKKKTGITDLSQIREKRWPVRVLAAGVQSNPERILSYFGLSKDEIEAAGGHIGNSHEDEENFDIAIGSGDGSVSAPEWRVWLEISEKYDLEFIQLPDDLLKQLAEENKEKIGIIPVGLYRGIEQSIPTVVSSGTAIYGRDDMPDDFAYNVAKAMDEQQQLLQWTHLKFSYNVHTVWKAFDVPLHPGAERYYRERGYIE
ncbi:MAG: TAXI family TRAP transporter solute-binding subunit [Chitinispirillaceae bacterium]|nr:TAXI family TRAP transporter solute-binding subunit [Chitinispirillaceae bacterium]